MANHPSKRLFLDYVVLANGLAILLVVIGHVLMKVGDSPAYSDVGPWNGWAVSVIYSFHMPLFFLLSGLLAALPGAKLHGANPPFGTMLRDRARRILLPYLTLSLVHVPARVVFYEHLPLSAVPRALPTILYAPTGHLWFVYVLFLLFLLVPLLEEAVGRRPWLMVLLLAAGYLGVRLGTSFHPAGEMTMGFTRRLLSFCEIGRVIDNAIYFYVGLLLGRAHVNGPEGWNGLRRGFLPFLAAFLLLTNLRAAAAGKVVALPLADEWEWLLTPLTALSGSLACLQACRLVAGCSASLLTRGLRILGDYSYDIYLFHFILVNLLAYAVLPRGWPLAAVVPASLLVVTCLPLAWARFVLDRNRPLAFICRGASLHR